MLLEEAVSQDGHGGEADVVHGQIGGIIQRLGIKGAAGGKGRKRRINGWGTRGLHFIDDKTHTGQDYENRCTIMRHNG